MDGNSFGEALSALFKLVGCLIVALVLALLVCVALLVWRW